MSGMVLLAHGDDAYQIDRAVAAFTERAGAIGNVVLTPERAPDEPLLERAGLEAATVGLFGAHCVVIRQPLRAAGTSSAAADRLVGIVEALPEGAALALAELRPSRDVGRPPALLGRLEAAVRAAGGDVMTCAAPRRDELRGWVSRHAEELGIDIRPPAAAALAVRIGGVWENDVERSEQTRVADSELRKLAIAVEDRPIEVGDVEALVADVRPPSVNAVANAVERRDGRRAAEALQRAFDEGEPVLKIMAALEARVADLIVARDLQAQGATPAELTKRLRPGNPTAAGKIATAAKRYTGEELEAMLTGLFAADLAIKTQSAEPEAALAAWLGSYVLGSAPAGARA